MKLKWNKEVQMLIIIVLVLVVVPVAYVTLFSAQAITAYKKANAPRVQLQAYNTQKECEVAEDSDCEMVNTEGDNIYWITSKH